ncbi:hypothetical protein MIND_01430600 [Mycena indigotica]|uniref:Uncharacterized protein n=1 Tax=Mycena indigotica TaxID=2126181 RepID=A0A8H6RW93_9AGAR|nr:uncharacterized protein MIND_01430600 [Mycena indigotica]KAF7288484.1 hypothetical protein MIND_01430600 [Mycena indigotica]
MLPTRRLPDTWTANGVESTFRVSFDKDSSPTGTTDVCGWGWRFKWDSSYGPIAVYFDPYLVANAETVEVWLGLLFADVLLQPPLESLHLRVPIYRASSKHSEFGAYRLLRLTISFEATFALTPPQPVTIQTRLPFSDEPLPTRVRAALVDTIHGGELIDVKFWAYSRARNGYVCAPRPLYGNLRLMRGTSKQFDEDLDDMFSGFSESGQTDITNDQAPEDAFDGYDYMSDSDLEDGEEFDGEMESDEKEPPFAGPSTQRSTPPDVIAQQELQGRRSSRDMLTTLGKR